MNYWMSTKGKLFPCFSHEEFYLQYLNNEYGEDFLDKKSFAGCSYGYECLEKMGWVRLKITKIKLNTYTYLKNTNRKQEKEIKDYCLENNLLLEEG